MMYSEREVFDRLVADFQSRLHTSFPAQVLAYDAVEQTVDVRPAVKREYRTDDVKVPYEYEDLPDIYAVPILWPRAGGFSVTFPIAVGDWVKIDCCEESLLKWRVTGQTREHPGVVDPHGLNGCVAAPGWYPDTQKLSSVSTTDLVLQGANASIRITPTGQVIAGEVSGAQFVALANLVLAELQAMRTWANGHLHAFEGVPEGSPGSTAVPTTPMPAPGSVAATKVKAK